MKKYRWLYIIAFAASVIGFIATDKKQILALLVFLATAFLVSALFWLINAKRFEIEAEIEDVSVCGNPVSANIVVHRSSVLPSGPIVLEMEYENIIFGNSLKQEIVLNPGLNKRAEYSLPYIPEYCGKTSVTIKSAKTFDILGLLGKTILKNKSRDIIIYPNIRELEVSKNNVNAIRDFGDYYDTNKKGNDAFEVFDMRDYQQGDSIKSIHWKLSGKFDKLIIREMSNPTNFHTAMFYNTYIGGDLKDEEKFALQNSVLQMAASLSKSLIKNGFVHHIISIDDLKEKTKFVQDNNSYLQGLSEMMSRKVHISEKDNSEQLSILSEDKRFGNLFYICAELDNENISALSLQSHVTVVYINNKNEESIDKSQNSTIISLPADKISGNIKAIEF